MQKSAATAKTLRHLGKLVQTYADRPKAKSVLNNLLSRISPEAHGARVSGALSRGQEHAQAGILDRLGNILGSQPHTKPLHKMLSARRVAVGARPTSYLV